MTRETLTCSTCQRSFTSGEMFCPYDGARLQGGEKPGATADERGSVTELPDRQIAQRADPKDPWIGRVIGDRYRILAFIGAGGMASVYVARHEMLGRVLAIKLLRRNLPTSTHAKERFRREAQTVSRINHENVVYLTDFGETDDGTLYMVMEYLAGKTLAELVQTGGRLEPQRATAITIQVARALESAHAVGVIHRDLKPENIMLVEPGTESEKVKILDFGIAKLLDAENAQERLTRAGMVFGTPEYMSPEQAMGQELDGRSDLYSLGLILWEMLVGRRCFHGRTAPETLAMQVTCPAVPPSSALPPGSSLPGPLDQLVMSLLAKDREQRCNSARLLVRELVALRAAWRSLPASSGTATGPPRPRQLTGPPLTAPRVTSQPGLGGSQSPPSAKPAIPPPLPGGMTAPPPPPAFLAPSSASGIAAVPVQPPPPLPAPPPAAVTPARGARSAAPTQILADPAIRQAVLGAKLSGVDAAPLPPSPSSPAPIAQLPARPELPPQELATARRRYRDLLMALGRRLWSQDAPPEIEHARREVDRIEESMLDLATDIALLQEDVEELRVKGERYEQRNREQMTQVDRSISQVVRELAPQLTQRDELQRQLRVLEAEEGELTRRLQELEKTLENQEGATVGVGNPEVGLTCGRLAMCATQRDRLRQEQSSVSELIEGLQREVTRLRTEQTALLHRTEEERQSMKREFARLSQTIAAKESEAEMLNRSLEPHLTALLIRLQAVRGSLPALRDVFGELDQLRVTLGKI